MQVADLPVGAVRTIFTDLDTHGIHVDDDEESAVEMGSPEEATLLTELEALLVATNVAPKWETFKAKTIYTELPLWCLRARHTVPKAAELLPRLMGMMEELEIGGGDQQQLRMDLESKAIVGTGTTDAQGRALIWIRGCYEDPRRTSAKDMARLVATVVLHALFDARTHGVVFLLDCSGAGIKNFNPWTPKALIGTVLPNLPVRFGRTFIVNPSWIATKLFPVIAHFMSVEFKQRHVIIHGAKKELWASRLAYFDVPHTSIPTELGGSAHVDCAAFAARVCASCKIAPQRTIDPLTPTSQAATPCNTSRSEESDKVLSGEGEEGG